MSDPAFDPLASLGGMKVRAAAPEPPAAAGGEPDAAPPAAPADGPARRREEALKIVELYRRDHPGDPRTDAQLLVAPYGGYEMLETPPEHRKLRMERLAMLRPSPPPPETPK